MLDQNELSLPELYARLSSTGLYLTRSLSSIVMSPIAVLDRGLKGLAEFPSVTPSFLFSEQKIEEVSRSQILRPPKKSGRLLSRQFRFFAGGEIRPRTSTVSFDCDCFRALTYCKQEKEPSSARTLPEDLTASKYTRQVLSWPTCRHAHMMFTPQVDSCRFLVIISQHTQVVRQKTLQSRSQIWHCLATTCHYILCLFLFDRPTRL